MQRIAQVTARIREIQSRVESGPVPGQFQAVLDRSLNSHDGAARNAEHSHGAPANAMAMWAPVPPMTLGVMLGLPEVSPASSPPLRNPIVGIMSAEDLDTYLEVHNIESRNGRLDDHDLVAVSGGWHGSAKLLPPAAVAWEEMRAAAAIDGIDLKVIDSYRSWETQARAYEKHLRGEKKANVLPPGRSEHGNGLAVDITNGSIIGTDDPEWAWLQDNARRFGWYPISNETWHWEFRGVV